MEDNVFSVTAMEQCAALTNAGTPAESAGAMIIATMGSASASQIVKEKNAGVMDVGGNALQDAEVGITVLMEYAAQTIIVVQFREFNAGRMTNVETAEHALLDIIAAGGNAWLSLEIKDAELQQTARH
jgi:hypothetical protein